MFKKINFLVQSTMLHSRCFARHKRTACYFRILKDICMAKNKNFNFSDMRLNQSGLRMVLGELEFMVMSYLWNKKDITVREVLKTLSADREIAYTTIMTTMDRLWKKGLLERKKEGKTFLYTPAQTKDRILQSMIKKVFDSILPDVTDSSISYFINSLEKINPNMLDELENLLKKRQGKED